MNSFTDSDACFGTTASVPPTAVMPRSGASRAIRCLRLRQGPNTFAGTLLGVALAAAALNGTVAFAQTDPVVGHWTTIDDKTHQPKSIIRIDLVDQKLQGTIVKIFTAPGERADPVCEQCKDHRKDKPIIGMTIMTGLKKSSNTSWDGGEILDPNNGSIYKVKLSLMPDAKALDVRGYIGVPMLGRTQTWVRD